MLSYKKHTHINTNGTVVKKQQFYHMPIISADIRTVEIKAVFAFTKDSRSTEERFKVSFNLRIMVSQGAITFCKVYFKIKCVAFPTPQWYDVLSHNGCAARDRFCFISLLPRRPKGID